MQSYNSHRPITSSESPSGRSTDLDVLTEIFRVSHCGGVWVWILTTPYNKKWFLRFESVWSISTQCDILRFPSPLDSHLAVNILVKASPQPPLVQSYPVKRDLVSSHVVDSRNRLWIHFRQDSQIFFEIRELCKNFVVEINLETAKRQLKTGLNRNKLVQSE